MVDPLRSVLHIDLPIPFTEARLAAGSTTPVTKTAPVRRDFPFEDETARAGQSEYRKTFHRGRFR